MSRVKLCSSQLSKECQNKEFPFSTMHLDTKEFLRNELLKLHSEIGNQEATYLIPNWAIKAWNSPFFQLALMEKMP